ncbi:hypothetical protein [Brevibacterium picturae]|uniref:Uncharacterized protein n=1 Tax=Brevibacterium picturae TaxID=260553 RepID=A0ABN2C6R5_9MICO
MADEPSDTVFVPADFELDVLFAGAAFAEEVFAGVPCADEPFLEGVFAGAAFAVELFAGADSEPLSAFVDVFADDDPAVVPDLGFRRRDDCIDAAGSVRAARGAFASSVP